MLSQGGGEQNLPPRGEGGRRPGPRRAERRGPEEAPPGGVGPRHGRAIVLRVDAAGMARDGALFTRSANGVWLVDAVPPQYLRRP